MTKQKRTSTSISVPDRTTIAAIKKAADLLGESVSKFMVAAANAEAARVLKGACPTCGRGMRGT